MEPELIGGALLGAGVVYGLPLLGQLLRPVATTAVQLGYSAVVGAGDLLAGARDQVEGIVATAPRIINVLEIHPSFRNINNST